MIQTRSMAHGGGKFGPVACLTIEVINDMTEAERLVITVYACRFNADIARDHVSGPWRKSMRHPVRRLANSRVTSSAELSKAVPRATRSRACCSS